MKKNIQLSRAPSANRYTPISPSVSGCTNRNVPVRSSMERNSAEEENPPSGEGSLPSWGIGCNGCNDPVRGTAGMKESRLIE